jgi:hypothetical protein
MNKLTDQVIISGTSAKKARTRRASSLARSADSGQASQGRETFRL